MPVDLSQIGLEGQQAFYTRMESAARTRALDVNSQAQAFETEQSKRLQQLSDVASAKLNSVVNREAPTGTGDENLPEPDSYADPLAIAADVFMRGGAPKMGMEMLKAASEISKRESDIKNDAITARKNKIETLLKGADAAGQYLGKAMNDSEWQVGVNRMEEAGYFTPEQAAQLRQGGWSPEIRDYFADQAVSVAQQAQLDLQQAQIEHADARKAADLSRMDRRIQMQQARDKETARHNRVTEKESGNKASPIIPTEVEIKQTRALLKTSIFKDIPELTTDEVDSAAAYIASQAKQLVRENPAIDWATATQQATMKAQQNGVFEDIPGVPGLFGTSLRAKSKSVEFDPSKAFDGKTPATAMAMPSSEAEAKKGMYYITAKGRAKWNGSAFVPAK